MLGPVSWAALENLEDPSWEALKTLENPRWEALEFLDNHSWEAGGLLEILVCFFRTKLRVE